MLTFLDFINDEDIGFSSLTEGRYIYHGTTSYNLPSILQHGLVPSTGKGNRKAKRVYVTRDGSIASTEAHATCFGDGATHTHGQGGEPVVLKIDRLHPKLKGNKFKVDKAWHRKDKQIKKLHSFHTSKPIHPSAIKSVHLPYHPNHLGPERSKKDALGSLGLSH